MCLLVVRRVQSPRDKRSARLLVNLLDQIVIYTYKICLSYTIGMHKWQVKVIV